MSTPTKAPRYPLRTQKKVFREAVAGGLLTESLVTAHLTSNGPYLNDADVTVVAWATTLEITLSDPLRKRFAGDIEGPDLSLHNIKSSGRLRYFDPTLFRGVCGFWIYSYNDAALVIEFWNKDAIIGVYTGSALPVARTGDYEGAGIFMGA